MKKILLVSAFTFITTLSFAQEALRRVEGRVTASDEPEGLAGVSIVIKNTAKGTVTDVSGNYTLEVGKADVLVYSFIGYKPQEVSVGNQSKIDVNLAPDIAALEEVVVIGYGETSQRKLVTAVGSVGTEAIEDKPFVNLEQSIQGKLAGVQVQQASGRPGGGLTVRIRGATSVSAGNDPLYVVDGVPVLNTEGINPNDIASIDVLKDASSGAIYGARAANGVVLITTKRGSAGAPTFNFSMYTGIDQVVNTIDVLNTEQFIDYLNTARDNAGLPLVDEPFGFQNNTDWQRELFDPALIQNYQLSFSGGGEKSNFYVSGGYQNQEGVIAPSAFERFSIRANQDRSLTDRFRVGSSIALSRTTFESINDNQRVNSGGVILSALTTPPSIPVQNPDGTFPLNPYQAWENPIALVRGEERSSFSSKILANVYGEYTLPLGIVFKSSFGVDYNDARNTRFVDPFTTGNGRANQGEASHETFNELVWLWENTLTYDINIDNKHFLGLLAGQSAQHSRWERNFLLGRGFANGAVRSARGAANPIDIDAEAAEWAIASYFFRANYDYDGKYLASVSMRTDGSSRFGAGNRFALFPSASVGWNMAQEGFLANAGWIDMLKVRYSFGITGNQNIGNYTAFGLFSTGADYPFDGEVAPGIRPNQLENEDLKWETTAQHNLGIDFAAFNNRLEATVDIYTKRTEDMLLFTQLPHTSGFDGVTRNFGVLENKGVELALGGVLMEKSGFRWDMNANISVNRNRVENIGDPIFGGGIPDQGNVSILQEGQPINNFFGWVAQGVDPETGDMIFADIDQNGVINDQDRQVIGRVQPDFIWGATQNLSYKGLTLTAFFQGVQGQDVYNATRFELESMSSFKNQSRAVLDRWSEDNRDGTLPRAVFGDPNDNDRASTRWVEDGSFIKLRELTLAYQLPQKILQKLRLKGCKLYLQGRNLYVWTDYSGYDPEVSRVDGQTVSPNIDYGTYPQVRSYLAGINVNF